MLTKVQRWGNSLGVRIPRSYAAEAEVEAGSTVDIAVRNGDLVLSPVRRRRYALSAMLEQVTDQNRHEEVSTSAPVGREVW